ALEQDIDSRCTIGIATPGTLNPDGSVKNSNTICLNGQPLQRDLETLLMRPVRLENDANCFALAEAIGGAGRGAHTVFGVIMGTGVGGGIVVGGQLLPGLAHIAGEWGHNCLEPDGPRCYCGRNGCVETFLSGPGFAADYQRLGGSTGLTPPAIVQRAQQGDGIARAALERLLERFGRALASVINILDPHAVVLGGGLSNLEALYSEGPEHIAQHVFDTNLKTPILRNLNGDSAGVHGAAQLWPT
ncbi:MAG: ROK family protein, partial [Arenicellales bacterium]|nr:ROK family protein [Arenicellales bacterium]